MDSDYGPGDAPGDSGGGGVNLGGGGFDTGAYSDYGWGQSDNTPGYSSGDYGQNVFGALDRALAGEDLDKSSLETLAAAGLGKVDISPTQNVEQALAARNVHNVLNYAVPALVSMVPGYGTVSALGKGIANIHGLMTGRLTPAEVMPGLAAGLIGAKTGIPSGILEGLFEGNLGKAAGAGAQAGLGALASNFGPLGTLAYGLSGLGGAVNKGVSEAVSGATGGGRSAGLGALPGASSAPSSSTTPTGSASGDLGITQEVSPTRAAIEQAVQQSVTPSLDRQMLAGRYGPIMQYEYGA